MLKKIFAFGFGLGAISLLLVSFFLRLNYISSWAGKNEAGLVRLEVNLSIIFLLVPALFAIASLVIGLKKPGWAGVVELVLGGLELALGLWLYSISGVMSNTTGYWLIDPVVSFLVSGGLLVVSGFLFMFVRRSPSKPANRSTIISSGS